MAHYFDTSALAKLVVLEPETLALQSWLNESDRVPTTSNLVRTELLRITRRVNPERMLRARGVIDSIQLIQLTTSIFEQASRLDPEDLRSLDALHLAAALGLGDDLESFVTYDKRLAEAAIFNGVQVSAPS